MSYARPSVQCAREKVTRGRVREREREGIYPARGREECFSDCVRAGLAERIKTEEKKRERIRWSTKSSFSSLEKRERIRTSSFTPSQCFPLFSQTANNTLFLQHFLLWWLPARDGVSAEKTAALPSLEIDLVQESRNSVTGRGRSTREYPRDVVEESIVLHDDARVRDVRSRLGRAESRSRSPEPFPLR